jgi:predicted RNase H-like HicB family nuclease
MLRAIQIRVFPGEQSGYVAECIDLPVVSQGDTIDFALKNVREALELCQEGEDSESLGISTTAPLLTTLQLAPLNVPA